MALDITKLAKVSGAVNQQYVYNTPDAIATVVAANYFNSATNNLKQFDSIQCITSTGTTPVIETLSVTSATGAAVVVVSAVEGVP